MLGSFRVIVVTPHTLVIDENEIHNTVTIYWASTAPSGPQENSTTQHKTAEHSLATDLQEPE